MHLISDNDWKAVADALAKHKHLVLPRTMGEVRVIVETVEACDPWPVPMLVEVVMHSPNKVQRQFFMDADTAKNAVKTWRP